MEDIPKTKNSRIPPATDDDWLRSRTSRLLGLVDDDDSTRPQVIADHTGMQKGRAPKIVEEHSRSGSIDASIQSDNDVDLINVEAGPTSEVSNDTSRATNRLFVRNLPYTAIEADIEQHIEQHNLGSCEEVGRLDPILTPKFLVFNTL